MPRVKNVGSGSSPVTRRFLKQKAIRIILLHVGRVFRVAKQGCIKAGQYPVTVTGRQRKRQFRRFVDCSY